MQVTERSEVACGREWSEVVCGREWSEFSKCDIRKKLQPQEITSTNTNYTLTSMNYTPTNMNYSLTSMNYSLTNTDYSLTSMNYSLTSMASTNSRFAQLLASLNYSIFIAIFIRLLKTIKLVL